MVVAGPPPDGQRVFHCNEGFQPGLITTTKHPSFPHGCDKYFLLSQGNDPSPPDVVTVIKPISVPNDDQASQLSKTFHSGRVRDESRSAP